MKTKTYCIVMAALICLFSGLYGQLRTGQTARNAWDQLLLQDPSAADDPRIGWKERLILFALTPEQAREYYEGADPHTLLLENGETLQQYLNRAATPSGNLYYPLHVPCPLFRLEGVDSSEAIALKAWGGDLSQQGGSPTGCGIPEEASALMVQVKVEIPSGLPSRVKLWSMDRPEPAESLVDSFTGHFDSTMMVVPLDRLERSGLGELQAIISGWAVLEGQVAGYFRQPAPGDSPVGEWSFFKESTDLTNADFFGYNAGGNATGAFITYIGKHAGYGATRDTPNSGSWNVFVGNRAGFSNTTGDSNLFSGSSAGSSNTTGSQNVFAGTWTGIENTTGDDNVFAGFSAGYYNTSGSENVFTGSAAGYNNETGSKNVFSGFQSGYNNKGLITGVCEHSSCGSYNVFSGSRAGYSNTTGSHNVSVGNSSGYYNTTGSANIFVGASSGLNNTTGSDNIFIGFQAGFRNTVGSQNTFSGRDAGLSNTSGSNNVFSGFQAGYRNATGSNNVFSGYQAGYNNRGWILGTCDYSWCGSFNVYSGYGAGSSNTTGSFNVISGSYAGVNNVTGSENVFSGYYAGKSNKFGDRNTMIGSYADLDPGPDSDPVTNATAIGSRAYVTQPNSLVLGSIKNVNGADASVSVGIGTTAPSSPLHVVSNSSLARVIVSEHVGTETVRNMMDLKNNGMAQFRLIDTSADGDAWQFSNTDRGLNISLQGSGSQEFLIENDGDVWINNGTVMVTSFRESKENFRDLDSEDILNRVVSLPISDWNYKKDADTIRHIGPVSEDFYEAFGYGEDNRHISPNDLAGVNTAAIQELNRQNQQLKAMLLEKIREMETLKNDLAEVREILGILQKSEIPDLN